ncbi:hypothetical protein PFLUV_G00205660 [Perca fluviatilis]|uniref:Uncharacterized protein n=1 Tax=Perca fluviatilis TaxID=8168 RepID=A0A6A5EHW3_PERFL|nr:hypothetical protein PFLUV_G00205660 [Perca fluviatilis]
MLTLPPKTKPLIEMNPYSTVSSNQNELDRSITLHLKISCPDSPAHSQTSSLGPGDAPPRPPSQPPPPRPPAPQLSIQVDSDCGESGFYSRQHHRFYPPQVWLPPPEIHRDFRQKLHAHFGDSCAETVL